MGRRGWAQTQQHRMGHVPTKHGTSTKALRDVAKAALEPIATAAIGIFVFSGHAVVVRLFVGVGQVTRVCDECFIPAEVQLVVFEAGRSLKQTATS